MTVQIHRKAWLYVETWKIYQKINSEFINV